MNLAEYLINKNVKSMYRRHETYIEILTYDFNVPKHVIIDQDVDIYGTGVIYSHKIIGIISSARSLWIEYNKIISGSFITHRIYDLTEKYINGLMINGYVMNNGVLS